jgi:hypothetical protein
MRKQVSDTIAVLARAPLPSGEQLRITLQRYRGQYYLNIRVWWENHHTGTVEWCPSGKGFVLPVDFWPKFITMLKQADKRLTEVARAIEERGSPEQQTTEV